MAPSLYPLTFSPAFKDYAWGGENLARVLSRPVPAGRVAESWEVSAHPNGPTPISNGAWAGRSLQALFEELGADLVGRRNDYALELGRFPLLIKFLDANEWLSVQVHPRDRDLPDGFGKTEMWVVLDARPGAEIVLGLSERVGPEELRAAARNGGLEALLHRLPARTGDVFFVPAGTVHAIGPGLVIAEIQQSSDTTYRLYDWDRQGATAAERPLHLEEALSVLDYDAVRPRAAVPTLAGGTETLAGCRYFQTDRVELSESSALAGSCTGQTLELWCLLEGDLSFEYGPEAESIAAPTHAWVLLPAALGDYAATTRSGACLLRVTTPPAAA